MKRHGLILIFQSRILIILAASILIFNCTTDELFTVINNPHVITFSGAQAIVVENKSNEERFFEIIVNNRRFYSSSHDIITDSKLRYGNAREATGLSEIKAIWLNTASKVNHNSPFTGLRWQHNPVLFFNSIGNGLCDDVANINESLWRYMDYPARTWYLDGHVVSEVYQGGKWKMFDSDLAFYPEMNDTILSVLEIGKRKEVLLDKKWQKRMSTIDVTLPRNKEYWQSLDWRAISDIWAKFKYVDHYKPKDDSTTYNYNLKLPPGSQYIFGKNITPLAVPFYFPSPNYYNLIFKTDSITNFKLDLFLVPVKITGEGYVLLNGERFEISDCNPDFFQQQSSLIREIIVEKAKDLEISYMVNSYVFHLFETDRLLYEFRLEGNNLDELTLKHL